MPQQNFTFLLFGIVVFLQILSAISGYSLVNSFWTNLERMQGIIQSVHLLVFSLILFSIYKSFKEWIFILRSVAAVGLLVAFFGFLESFGIFLPNIFNYFRPPRLTKINVHVRRADTFWVQKPLKN